MEVTNKSKSSKLHVVMFPWFAFGHINPFLQISNNLSTHGVQISFLSIPGNISRIKKSSFTPSNLITIIPLTIPEVEGISPDFDSSSDLTLEAAELLKIALDKMQPQVKTLLSELKPHIVVFDFAQYWVPPLAAELGIKAVHFCVYSAVSNAYLVVPSRMSDPNNPPTIDDLKKSPPGFPETSLTSVPTHTARDFMYLFTRFHGGPSVFERGMSFNKSCDAIIYKSCAEMEGPYIDYLKTQLRMPLLFAGPTAPSPPFDDLEEQWETWLSTFPESSVIFCNFGSETFLDEAQIKELTLGFELTGLPFILVLNFGTRDKTVAQAKLEQALPNGFRERVKDRGIVHIGWVQQQHILAHKNVGCYVNHSGFSSVIEAIVNDCQLVFVPQKGDQFLNSKLFSGDLRVGVEVSRRDEDGYFAKEDILEAVKTVMVDVDEEPGKSIRDNQKKWKEFLLSTENEEKYIVNLVKELHNLAGLTAQ